MTGQWLSLGTPVYTTNKTNRHDIAEILLKVVLNIIALSITTKVMSLNPAHGEVYSIQHYVIVCQ